MKTGHRWQHWRPVFCLRLFRSGTEVKGHFLLHTISLQNRKNGIECLKQADDNIFLNNLLKIDKFKEILRLRVTGVHVILNI